MRLGALGGPGTFAGQAAERFRGEGEVTYFGSGTAEWRALDAGKIDAFVMLAESSATGPGELARRAASPDFGCYVLAEAQVPYGCLLLAKPGSGPIRRILGHGSVSQCKVWLDAHYAGIQIEVQETSSLDAAEKVLRGDGSLALVGTRQTATEFGLEVVARDIDGGATGRYWLVGREARFAEEPELVLISGRFGGEDGLGRTIAGLASEGFVLRTLACWPTGRALFEFDYSISFAGSGGLERIRHALAGVPAARLVGACRFV